MAINTTYTQDNASQAAAAPAFASGRITYGSDSITATDHTLQTLGFTPRYVRFWNVTDRISIEWFEGMAAETCLKTAANGAQTLETANGGVTVCDSDGTANTSGRSFKVLQNATLAVIAASKVVTWVAFG
jgi:hypothetical protein